MGSHRMHSYEHLENMGLKVAGHDAPVKDVILIHLIYVENN